MFKLIPIKVILWLAYVECMHSAKSNYSFRTCPKSSISTQNMCNTLCCALIRVELQAYRTPIDARRHACIYVLHVSYPFFCPGSLYALHLHWGWIQLSDAIRVHYKSLHSGEGQKRYSNRPPSLFINRASRATPELHVLIVSREEKHGSKRSSVCPEAITRSYRRPRTCSKVGYWQNRAAYKTFHTLPSFVGRQK